MTARPRTTLLMLALGTIPMVAVGTFSYGAATTPEVTISASPDRQGILAGRPCLPAPPITLGMANEADGAVYADTFVTADSELDLSRGMFSSYIPPSEKVTAPLSVSAPYGTQPGGYEVTLQSGEQSLAIPIEVSEPPEKQPGDNWLLGEEADSSTDYVTSSQAYDPCGAVDGDRAWSHSGAWHSDSRGEFPDTYTVTMPAPVAMNRVDLYLHESERYQVTDWDVRIMRASGQWQTVAQVRDNAQAHRISTFPVVDDALRVQIVGLDSTRHDYTRIAEVEAYLVE